MYLDNGYHLTYCTNIHPGESWDEVFRNLQEYLPPLKKNLSPDKPFGIGLRLSDLASRELLAGKRLADFKVWLQDNGLYVYTMNGFPFGGFHQQVVKDAVHKPDWTTRERVDYTIRLAHILAAILPEELDGGISTSPLSYKPWHRHDEAALDAMFRTSCLHLAEVVLELQGIKSETGKTIHIDIEPEPDGVLEDTEEFISFYNNRLLPIGIEKLKAASGISEGEAAEAIRTHIQLCYDVCHFALVYEQPADTFAKLQEAGIRIGKIQLSSALKVMLPVSMEERQRIADQLAPFAESTYLHQVVERNESNRLTHYTDLPQALKQIAKPEAKEWRTHFHVPLFTSTYNGLQSTQDAVAEVLELLQHNHLTNHLEAETYTWEVLPEDMKKELHASLQRELEWVLQKINPTKDAENSRT
ncbi:metabolite traffic protein EboE [Pontibacter sp. 172403-2]|uniref:metabolite traffic protein EboE n=1 Tax=Pontibacter rufus TaxID=2791028 RepID=UPI0018AFDF3B|nr:metabolite traffic protein EboE [Pontibacter sp. 172403-2]MBF9254487.1 metabolite traffic protein EboE [Pontibacter sp. 172403-2]